GRTGLLRGRPGDVADVRETRGELGVGDRRGGLNARFLTLQPFALVLVAARDERQRHEEAHADQQPRSHRSPFQIIGSGSLTADRPRTGKTEGRSPRPALAKCIPRSYPRSGVMHTSPTTSPHAGAVARCGGRVGMNGRRIDVGCAASWRIWTTAGMFGSHAYVEMGSLAGGAWSCRTSSCPARQ